MIFVFLVCGVIWIYLLLGGIISLLSPKTMWKMSEGWKYKHLEPSKLRLVTIQIKGLFLLTFAFGGYLLFLSLLNP